MVAPTAIDGRPTAKGFCSCFVGRRGVCGDAITLNRTVGPAGVLIEPSQTESLRHPAGRHHAVSDESTGDPGQHPERDQVEAIVFEDWCQAAGIAAAEIADVSRRNLSPRHVPDSMETEDVPLETHETTFVSLPEPPAGVQQVNVPECPEGRWLAMKREPRLGHRPIKRATVEGDDRVGLGEHVGDRAEHLRLVRKMAQEVLTGLKRVALEPTQPDKERNGPSSPT